jgi:hypothetical protein
VLQTVECNYMVMMQQEDVKIAISNVKNVLLVLGIPAQSALLAIFCILLLANKHVLKDIIKIIVIF